MISTARVCGIAVFGLLLGGGMASNDTNSTTTTTSGMVACSTLTSKSLCDAACGGTSATFVGECNVLQWTAPRVAKQQPRPPRQQVHPRSQKQAFLEHRAWH
eukprot:s5137_g2.t1